MSNKKKILFISDDIRFPSGVSNITQQIILGTISKYDWVQLAAHSKHPEQGSVVDLSESVNKTLGTSGAYLRLYCETGYGNPTILSRIIKNEKVDLVVHMTDSHYFEWLYNIEDEVRQSVPILYYHVWDNYPVPHNNKYIYDSCDAIACISKVTHDIVSQVSTNKSNIEYIPHGVCSTQFTTLPKENTINCKKNILETGCDFLFFCNNKNLRRKQLSTTIQSYYEFCLKIGEDRANKTCLLLHTNPIARNAPNLNEVADYFSDIGNILFSTEVVSSNTLCQMYNTADVTINIASNEGFGLSTLESLFCGTPIICTNTGGLTEQVHKDWGISLKPDVKNLIGSPSVPLLFDDIVSSKSLCDAMIKMYNKSDKELTEMGKRGQSFAKENYSLKRMVSSFDTFIEKTLKSFEPRKRYKLINLNK